MAVWQWSKIANNNATADPTISWPEGMPPSSVNDSARSVMTGVANWRDDLSGMLLDTGASGSAYVVTSNEGIQIPTPTDGTRISFIPANTNAANATLAVDGGTAFPIQVPSGTAIGAGVMVALTPYDLVFKTSVSAWLLKGVFQSNIPTLIPLGGIIDYSGSSAPNSNFVLPFGQAISRTTYSALFAIYNAVSLPYGSGDGSTTFNVPDCRGSVIAALDNMGGSARGVLTTATSLGVFGGEQNHLLSVGEMPSHSHTATDSGHTHTVGISATIFGGTGPGSLTNNSGSINTGTGFANISVTNTGGGGVHNNVQPTLVLSKILRVL